MGSYIPWPWRNIVDKWQTPCSLPLLFGGVGTKRLGRRFRSLKHFTRLIRLRLREIRQPSLEGTRFRVQPICQTEMTGARLQFPLQHWRGTFRTCFERTHLNATAGQKRICCLFQAT